MPHHHGLENRDFYVPKHNLNWKQLASELAKDKIRKQTTNFNYKKGTKQFDGKLIFQVFNNSKKFGTKKDNKVNVVSVYDKFLS